MSNKIIYMKSCDIALRYTLDEIAKLEKSCYNINDLLALKSLLDTLEEQILNEVSNNSQDHLVLCEAVQEKINPELTPDENQAKYVDSEYQLATTDYVNNLANEILSMKAPFTNTQYDKIVKIEQSLVADIDKIIANNNTIVEQINAKKESIVTSDNNTPELKEEAEAKKNSEALKLYPNEKLVSAYEAKIKAILSNSKEETESKSNISKWLSNYNINYGSVGNDFIALVKLTNQINDLYASLNDTSDYEAVQIFANTVLNTVASQEIQLGEQTVPFNEVPVEQRQEVLETAIDNAIVNEPEITQDKVRGLKSRLARFSADNYQFGEDDINALQNAANTATSEIDRLNAENETINAEIVAKTTELEEAKAAYEEKHEEAPEIEPVNENQTTKQNTEGIEDIINEINNVISSELPYITDFELEYDDTEIGINEDPRSRIITITNIQPELHKDAEFIVETSRPDTFTYTMENNEITVVATGTGDINLDVKAIIGEEEISKQVVIRVEKADIIDFTLTYDSETPMEVDEERLVAVEITPYWHKTTLFEIVKEENDDTFEVVSFSNETGNLVIKATGTGDISFIMKNGEIEKEVNIPVNIVVEETFTWYIGKNNFNESVADGVYSYDFDPANLPVVHSIDEIYTDNQDIESTDANIYVICPKEWINQGWVNGVWTGKFKLKDIADFGFIDLSYPDSNEPTIIGDLTVLKSLNTVSDSVVKVIRNENASTPEEPEVDGYYWYVGTSQDKPTSLPEDDSQLASGNSEGWRKIEAMSGVAYDASNNPIRFNSGTYYWLIIPTGMKVETADGTNYLDGFELGGDYAPDSTTIPNHTIYASSNAGIEFTGIIKY